MPAFDAPLEPSERPRQDEKIRWAPELRPDRIRRLYERDALGVVDSDLIDDVGLALHARCRSIVLVNEV